jgi:hypothetical protein
LLVGADREILAMPTIEVKSKFHQLVEMMARDLYIKAQYDLPPGVREVVRREEC